MASRSHMGITGERTADYRDRPEADFSKHSDKALANALLAAAEMFTRRTGHRAAILEAEKRLRGRRAKGF